MEIILYDHFSSFFENIFSTYHSGFRKGFNPQSCLVVMIEKFKELLDQGGTYAALLTALSKALGYLPQDLIITSLNANGLTRHH